MLVVVRATSLAGLSEFRFPIAVGKAMGVAGLGLLLGVLPRRVRGVWAVWMLGGSLNLVAMAASGWRMPVSLEAIRAVGMPEHHAGYVHATTWWQHALGDVVPVTWPTTTIVSLGDLCLVAGAIWLTWLLLGPQRRAAAEAPTT